MKKLQKSSESRTFPTTPLTSHHANPNPQLPISPTADLRPTSNQQPTTNNYQLTTKPFTLTEMLVVTGLILLLSTISIVAVTPMMKGGDLEAGASTIQTAIYQARTYAALNNIRTQVRFYTSGSDAKGKITLTDPAGTNPVAQPYFLPSTLHFANMPDPDGPDPDPDVPSNMQTKVVDGSKPYYMTFMTTGSLDTDDLVASSNVKIRIAGKQDDFGKQITVVHTTGLTRITDYTD